MTDLIKSEGVIQKGPYAGQFYFDLRPSRFPRWMSVYLNSDGWPIRREVPESVLEVLKEDELGAEDGFNGKPIDSGDSEAGAAPAKSA